MADTPNMARIESAREGAMVWLRPVGELTRYPEVHSLIEGVTALLMDESVAAIGIDLAAVSETGPLAVGALAALEMTCRSRGKTLAVVGVHGAIREILEREGLSV